MAVDKSILDLIPEGCHVNWNAKANKYYVYKSKYVYVPEKKRGKEIRTQVGTVVDGKFTFAKSYLLKQQIKELEARSTPPSVNETPAQSVKAAVREEVRDTRQQAKVVYPLDYVYLVSLLCSLSGHTSCVQIADYWKNNRRALESVFPDFPKQDISHDTIRRLLMLIDPSKFQSFYQRLVTPLLCQFGLRVIAADGQAVRASKNSLAKHGKYILSFYDTDNGIVLGQKLIGDKENEITHNSSMVKDLDLKGTVVTADALNTQTAFAKELIEAGADYCLAVKDNRKKLCCDIQLAFLERTETRTKHWESVELGHGRVEKRTVCVLPASVLEKKQTDDWIGLEDGIIIKASTETTNKSDGEVTKLDRYFICSLNWANTYITEQAARAVRRHWGIENELHYVLDVDFYQDRTQCKNANYIQNRTMLNKLALAVIRNAQKLESEQTGKDPTSVKRLMCKFANPHHAIEALAKMNEE